MQMICSATEVKEEPGSDEDIYFHLTVSVFKTYLNERIKYDFLRVSDRKVLFYDLCVETNHRFLHHGLIK